MKLFGIEFTWNGFDVWHKGNLSKLSQLTNDNNFISSVPIASSTTLGGVKQGANITIDANGVISASASGSQLVVMKNTVTLGANSNTISIISGGITAFNKDTDDISVYQNTIYIERNQDYTISADGLNIVKSSGTWASGATFYIKVMKNINTALSTTDGTLLQDGSVGLNKLSTPIQNIINAVPTFTTSATAPTTTKAGDFWYKVV